MKWTQNIPICCWIPPQQIAPVYSYSLFTLRRARSPLRINGERALLRVNRLYIHSDLVIHTTTTATVIPKYYLFLEGTMVPGIFCYSQKPSYNLCQQHGILSEHGIFQFLVSKCVTEQGEITAEQPLWSFFSGTTGKINTWNRPFEYNLTNLMRYLPILLINKVWTFLYKFYIPLSGTERNLRSEPLHFIRKLNNFNWQGWNFSTVVLRFSTTLLSFNLSLLNLWFSSSK